jgi:hypothetical protein
MLRRTGELCKRLRVTPFKNPQPSKEWFNGFKKRHSLSIRRAEKLGSSRARMMNPVVVNNYFVDLESIFDDLKLSEKPHCVWNCDETGRNFEHSPVRVIADKKERNVVGKTSNSRSNVTIMACVNVVGVAMPPMFIVKGKTSASLHGFNSEAGPAGSLWSYQENGWMTDQIGEKWFKGVFLKNCGPERPQLLILDGHSSHESLAILECAIDNNIQILSLPPHTTHILQPLDRCVFGPFSSSYNKACSDFMAENVLNTVNKWSFPGLIRMAWEEAFTPENIKSGFAACGIYPLNRSIIPDSAYDPSVPTDVMLASSSTMTTPSILPTPLVLSTSTGTTTPLSATLPMTSINISPATSAVSPVITSAVSLATTPATTSAVSPATTSDVSPATTSAVSPAITAVSTYTATTSAMRPAVGPTGAVTSFPVDEWLCQSSSPEVNESGPPEIDNPELLLHLIMNGEIEICDSPSQDVVQGEWNTEIQNLFLPPKPQVTPKKSLAAKRKVTGHRLLTSNEILLEKKELAQKKEIKLKMKQEREEKREQKRKLAGKVKTK